MRNTRIALAHPSYSDKPSQTPSSTSSTVVAVLVNTEPLQDEIRTDLKFCLPSGGKSICSPNYHPNRLLLKIHKRSYLQGRYDTVAGGHAKNIWPVKPECVLVSGNIKGRALRNLNVKEVCKLPPSDPGSHLHSSTLGEER